MTHQERRQQRQDHAKRSASALSATEAPSRIGNQTRKGVSVSHDVSPASSRSATCHEPNITNSS